VLFDYLAETMPPNKLTEAQKRERALTEIDERVTEIEYEIMDLQDEKQGLEDRATDLEAPPFDAGRQALREED
jgi:predicted  nucleic acid-binding Zn-ribbon protein